MPGAALTKPPDLHFLNGVRAISSIAVVLYHCHRVLGLLVGADGTASLLHTSLLFRLASLGNVAVDIFLLITTLLATYQLLPLLEGSAASSNNDSSQAGAAGESAHSCLAHPPPTLCSVVLGYYQRRIRRVLPLYILANLLILLSLLAAWAPLPLSPEAAAAKALCFGLGCPSHLWANALFATHLQGRYGCGLQLWSLSVQAFVWAGYPLLLCALRPRRPGFRTRLAGAIAAALLGGALWRLRMAASLELRFPFSGLPGDGASLDDAREALWWTFGGRVTVLAFGALLGTLLRTPAALDWLHDRGPLVSLAALMLQAAACRLAWSTLTVRLPDEAPWPVGAARAYAALAWCGSPLYGAAIFGGLLALALRSDLLHAAAADVLASRRLAPLGAASFSLYLVHEQARFLAIRLLMPSGLLAAWAAQAPGAAFVALCALSLAAAYPVALLCDRIVRCWQRL